MVLNDSIDLVKKINNSSKEFIEKNIGKGDC